MEYNTRPPFDERGYAAYQGQSKKKSATPLRWIIPAGLLAVIILVVIVTGRRPGKTEEFCRNAIEDALVDSFGTGDPLVKELRLDKLSKTLSSRNYALDTTLSVGSIDAAPGTMIYNLLDEIGVRPDEIPSGLGISFMIDSRKDQGIYGRASLAYSAIKIALLKLWGDGKGIIAHASRFTETGLTAEYQKLLDTWQDNVLWGLLPEKTAQEVKDSLKGFFTMNKLVLSVQEVRNSLPAGQSFSEALGNLLSKVRFSEEKNASGRIVQEKISVGGEYILCYAYRAEIDTNEVCKRLAAITGLKREDIVCTPDYETTKARLFITRRGELVSVDFETEVEVLGKRLPITFAYKATGEKDPQDAFSLTLHVWADEEPIVFECQKRSGRNANSVRSEWKASLMVAGQSFGIDLQSNYARKDGAIEISAKTYWDEVSVGGLEASGRITPEDEFSMTLSKMKFWDTFSGEAVTIGWRLNVAPKEGELSERPPKKLLDVTVMSREEWDAFYKELKDNIDKYMKTLSGLF